MLIIVLRVSTAIHSRLMFTTVDDEPEADEEMKKIAMLAAQNAAQSKTEDTDSRIGGSDDVVMSELDDGSKMEGEPDEDMPTFQEDENDQDKKKQRANQSSDAMDVDEKPAGM